MEPVRSLQQQNTPKPIPPQKESFWHRHLLAELVAIFLVAATMGIVYYAFASIPKNVTQPPIHKEKVDATADWKTYSNTDYGFEFKYPRDLNLYPTSNVNNLLVSKSFRNQSGILFISVTKGELALDQGMKDPSLKKEVMIGGRVGYSGYGYSDGPGGWESYRIPLDGNTLEIGFSYDDQSQEPLLIDNKTLQSQILSTFKFTK